MTEKQTQTQRTNEQGKRLEEKFDSLSNDFYEMKGDIKVILQRLEMQPKLDQQSFDGLKRENVNCQANANQRFNALEKDVKEIRDNQSWISKTVIGTILVIVLQAVWSATKGL